VRSLGDSDPRQVGPFRVLAGLDVDEMGPVLLGAAPDGRPAAVKLVSAPLAADDGFHQRFAAEVAGLRRVSGTRIAPVIDSAGAWVAVEFLPGPSVRQIVERGVLLGGDAFLLLAAGLVGALTELHRVGLVHRDLTSANVLLTDDSVRVLDFGVARALDRDVSQVVGAPEFMSPEQASGQPVTSAGDVFSLGALLHLAATGRSLFAGATRAETLSHVKQAQPELSASLPSHVRRVIAACLVREPGERPSLEQLAAMIGPIPPGPHPWPPLVMSMIAEQRAEVGRLLPDRGAPTTIISPVVVAPAPPPRKAAPRKPAERWKPDMWAIVSGGAVLLTIVFAIVMFNALTPDRPLRSSPSSAAAPVVTTTTTTAATTTQQALSGEVTGLAGKCMDIAGANTGSGTAVQLYACNGTDAQQWEFAPDGTVQSLGKCLDVNGGATNDGATVQIYDCNGTGAQQWTVGPDDSIINDQSGKCLDVPGKATADGTQLIIWTCHGEENQRWDPPA